MHSGATILEIRDLRKRFGGIEALADCSFSIAEREIVGLIGPNGSGKTTLFNVLVGYMVPDAGRVIFRGEDIGGLRPYQVARKGMARTFQITRIFPKMTVLENLLLPARGESAAHRACELLELVGLSAFADEYANDLSFGQQRLLSIAQVLMLEPSLVLLDEPAAGVNPTMQRKIVDLVHHLNDEGRTFLIIEHNMDLVMNNCQRIVVLNMGRKIAEGAPADVRREPEVQRAYFGS
ncbi:MAG: ABC transporter ATP-binding protein [Xanthobacteraceae bacterium]